MPSMRRATYVTIRDLVILRRAALIYPRRQLYSGPRVRLNYVVNCGLTARLVSTDVLLNRATVIVG